MALYKTYLMFYYFPFTVIAPYCYFPLFPVTAVLLFSRTIILMIIQLYISKCIYSKSVCPPNDMK